MAVVARMLRRAGAGAVYPLVLGSAGRDSARRTVDHTPATVIEPYWTFSTRLGDLPETGYQSPADVCTVLVVGGARGEQTLLGQRPTHVATAHEDHHDRVSH